MIRVNKTLTLLLSFIIETEGFIGRNYNIKNINMQTKGRHDYGNFDDFLNSSDSGYGYSNKYGNVKTFMKDGVLMCSYPGEMAIFPCDSGFGKHLNSHSYRNMFDDHFDRRHGHGLYDNSSFDFQDLYGNHRRRHSRRLFNRHHFGEQDIHSLNNSVGLIADKKSCKDKNITKRSRKGKRLKNRDLDKDVNIEGPDEFEKLRDNFLEKYKNAMPKDSNIDRNPLPKIDISVMNYDKVKDSVKADINLLKMMNYKDSGLMACPLTGTMFTNKEIVNFLPKHDTWYNYTYSPENSSVLKLANNPILYRKSDPDFQTKYISPIVATGRLTPDFPDKIYTSC